MISGNGKKYFTKEGFKKLKKELEYLKKVKRREIAERLKKCISYGDLSENSEYQETKDAQAFLEGRILELENLINNAIIISKKSKEGIVQIGSTILLTTGSKKERLKIVGTEETNPLEGKISIESPLGKALLNKSKGEVIEIVTPQGKVKYKILKIE